MIDYSTLQRDYATYLPAISRSYADICVKPLERSAPVDATDLNFLDPNSTLFHYPYVLYSAGQADLQSTTPCNVSQRCTGVLALGDSGGFQIINGRLKIKGKIVSRPNDAHRKVILDWLERHSDWAMTLDVPPNAIGVPQSGYTRFRDCLADTAYHLIYFQKHRNGNAKLLNCLHGRNGAECDLWYNAVRDFGFEGWAFGSGYSASIYLILRRLLRMLDEKKLVDGTRLHFLGQGNLKAACAMTSIQRSLRKHVGANVSVTFDASTPFTRAASYQAYQGYNLTGQRFAFDYLPMASTANYVGSTIPFPWRTPIGERLTIGDLCTKKTGKVAWDGLSLSMVMNHNLFVHLEGILAANRVYELDSAEAKHFCPPDVLEKKDLIAEAFEVEQWDVFLKKNRNVLRSRGKSEIDEGLNALGDF